jgi:hypothetical protein
VLAFGILVILLALLSIRVLHYHHMDGVGVSFFSETFQPLRVANPACFYGEMLASVGITPDSNAPNPWNLAMTFADATADANGLFVTSVDVHFEIGTLAIVNHGRPAILGTGISNGSPYAEPPTRLGQDLSPPRREVHSNMFV